ncbi:hypothetical protein [Kocuria sp. TGY1127_2]|uniref:hypothetical protein n=1 Tax=Kocuria sp. TGY1127_2 TaxID=2711328 RepID=UPI0015BF0912|nr:hypothetical protein [Kocuria sp. TGY1127_2]
MDIQNHRSDRPTCIQDSEAFVHELVNRAPDKDPSNGVTRTLVAWGDRRIFMRITEDVARAADIGLRRVGPGENPLIGPLDAMVMEAEQALTLSGRAEKGLSSSPGPHGPLVVAGFDGGEDPWDAARKIARFWRQPDVVMLPQGRAWLADRLASAQRTDRQHPTIGVLGTCGGIGTSTTSLWIGSRLLEDGDSPIIVDAVPGSTALEACVAPDPLRGLRWQDIRRLPKRPDPAGVVAAVPSPHGLPILSGDPDEPDEVGVSEAELWETIEDLAREAVPVVDLGAVPLSWSCLETTAVLRCSALLLLVPFTLRGLCQAKAACQRWSRLLPIVPVGTGPRWCDVSDADVAQAIGMPLATAIPHVIAVHDAYESGHLLEVAYRRPLRRTLGEIVDALKDSIMDFSNVARHVVPSVDQQFASIALPARRRFEGRSGQRPGRELVRTRGSQGSCLTREHLLQRNGA